MDEAEAKLRRPLSSNSMALSCRTSEYILRSWKGESIRPVSTALEMVPMPDCKDCSEADSRPIFTSWRRNWSRWAAMALVSASGGRMLEGLSSFSVMTMAAILVGSMGMKGTPMRCSGLISGMG